MGKVRRKLVSFLNQRASQPHITSPTQTVTNNASNRSRIAGNRPMTAPKRPLADVKENSKISAALLRRSRAFDSEGDPAASLDALLRAYEVDVSNELMGARYAKRLIKARKWQESRQVISKIIKMLSPSNSSMLLSKDNVCLASFELYGIEQKIEADRETIWEMGTILLSHPSELFHLPSFRARLSRQRRHRFIDEGNLKLIEENENIIENAVIHNVEKLEESSDDGARPNLLINPLSSIDYISVHKKTLKVLTIGSRSESELFCLYAAGFKPENVSAIDLISYTPLIQSGDAHELPYEENSFDIIVAGWVLAYSRSPDIMAKEIMRVARPHAYIAAGCAYTPPGRGKGGTSGTNISGTRFSSIADITDLFSDRMKILLFQSPIERERMIGTAALACVFQLD